MQVATLVDFIKLYKIFQLIIRYKTELSLPFQTQKEFSHCRDNINNLLRDQLHNSVLLL
jgi:hypothetical protein